MIQQKVEIRFQKGEAVRFISHHDLMRALLRAVRRAGLPVRLTEGYNPRPRIVFPVALEVGVASLDEVAEIEFNQCLETQDIFRRLACVMPAGLELKSVEQMPPFRAGRIAERIQYLLHLVEAGIQVPPERLPALLEAATLPFQRQRETHLQSVDLRPALLDLRIVTPGDLELFVRPSQSGSARPLEVLSLLTGMPVAELKRVRVTKLLMELRSRPEPVTPDTPISLKQSEITTTDRTLALREAQAGIIAAIETPVTAANTQTAATLIQDMPGTPKT